MISKKAKGIYNVLKIVKFKEVIDFMNPRRSKLSPVPLLLYTKRKIEKSTVLGRNVYNVSPNEGENEFQIIYFHGGGYAAEAAFHHFDVVDNLIKETNATVTFVEYPLTPEHNVHDAIEMVYEAYKLETEKHPERRFAIFGDSAGGGLGLALAMTIRDLNQILSEPIKAPEKIVLFSPWLDIGLTNPKIMEIQERDIMLDAEALREVGKRYAYNIRLEDYRVSPIFGDLTHLGSILVFYGSEEIFQPDCEAFGRNTGVEGTKFYGVEYSEMQHDWIVLPIPERDQTLKEAAEFLLMDQV